MKVGPSFSEYIHTEKRSRLGKNFFRDNDSPHMRSNWLLLICIIGIVVLLGRLFWVQLIKGQAYKDLSDSNRIRTAVIHAPRGVIFDRNGTPLVYNVPGFRQTVNGKTKLIDSKSAIDLLAKGETLEVDSLRNYPFKDAMTHIVGYIGQISPDELALPDYHEYKVGDVIGKMGVEQSYETVLKGLDGQALIEVDATGKPLRVLGTTDPIPGQNITLTVDSTLQQAVFDAMKNVKKGAAIVTKPDGEVLAMVSKPSFDPNMFTMGAHYEVPANSQYQSIEQVLLDNQGQPLLDRAIAGVYPPGSTFKPVVAAAALQDKVIDANYTVEDTGILRVGDFSFANWYYTDNGKVEGTVDVVKAIKRSNDIFFYKVGNLLGVDKLSAFANTFGLGHMTGIDLRGEAPGLVPTREWKEKVVGDKWYLGDDYHYGIGQGYLLTTPIQVNLWTQAIANAGTIYIPHLLKNIQPILKADNLMSPETTSLIREGMIEACSTGGVAWPLFEFKVKNEKLQIDGKDFLSVPDATDSAMRKVTIACKTGTAQHGDDTTLPHSWITLFAPAYHPQIIVTVLAEDSGEGSNVAGPIAKNILDKYFSGQ